MNPISDKSKNGVAPPIFNEIVETYTKVQVIGGASSEDCLTYVSMSADAINDVIDIVNEATNHAVITNDPKIFVVFRYTSTRELVVVNCTHTLALAKCAMVDTADEAIDKSDDDKEVDTIKKPDISVPMLFIGSAREGDLLFSVWGCQSTTVVAFMVDYKPYACTSFKKFELDSSPLVTLWIT